jgi:putative Ca2+/H+ antiporter (TMEM165/GDT1 family)
LQLVVVATTFGMLIANVPAVCLANNAALRIPVNAMRIVAAALFIVLGIGAIA